MKTVAKELPAEAEAVIRQRYDSYLAAKFKTGSRGLMTYKQFREKMIREGVALF